MQKEANQMRGILALMPERGPKKDELNAPTSDFSKATARRDKNS
jgi:hypothetical protein